MPQAIYQFREYRQFEIQFFSLSLSLACSFHADISTMFVEVACLSAQEIVRSFKVSQII